MNELKEHIQSISEVLKGECAKIAFWKENKHWYSYIFELTKNSVLTEFSKQFLENIQKDDPKAVAVDSGDFIEANGDGSILVDDMVSSVLFLYSMGQANISDFLEIYAEKQEQPQQIQEAFANEKPISLKELLERDLDLFQLDNIRIVYFQQEGNWHSRYFPSPVLNIEDMTVLKQIESVDNYAVAMCGHDFIAKESNTFVSLDEMASIVTSKHKDSSSFNNINFFLMYCEKMKQQQEVSQQKAQPIKPKLNKEHFLQSEEGKYFIGVTKEWYYSEKLGQIMKEHLKMAVNLALFTLRYCYDVNYDVNMNDDGFTIKTQDGADVLYSYTEKE